MSRQRAIDALRGQKTDRVAQMVELSHPGFLQHVSGLDPYEKTAEALAKTLKHLDVDTSILGYLEPPRLRNGQTRQDDHYTYTQWGVRETPWLTNPYYKTVDEILAFDPRTHDSSTLQEKVDRYCAHYENTERLFSNSVLYVPGHYQLVLHYMPFYCDWAVFMETLALEPDRCRFLFDRCASYSIEVFEALAQTPAPLIIAHEDLCSTKGPIFSPALPRQEVFPRFAQIYEPVKRAGKRILAFGEGSIEEIAPDLLEAGADGLYLDQGNNIEAMIDLVGNNGLLVGGCNTMTISAGTADEIQAEVQAKMSLAKKLPGFFFSLTGEAPEDVPVENLEVYFEACREFGKLDYVP